MRCLACDRLYTSQEVRRDTNRWRPGYRSQNSVVRQPAYLTCGDRLASSVVNFGDSLPEKEVELSGQHARRCDLMLVLGSSLVVEPAASLVRLALKSGARVVLINQGKTPYDKAATLQAWTGISEVISSAVEWVQRELG